MRTKYTVDVFEQLSTIALVGIKMVGVLNWKEKKVCIHWLMLKQYTDRQINQNKWIKQPGQNPYPSYIHY